MTALSPVAAPQREQTMEEILASIRKIIESNEAMAVHAEQAASGRVQNGPVVTPVPMTALIEPQTLQAPVAPAQSLTEQVAQDVPALLAAMPSNAVAGVERLVSQSPEKRVAAAFDDLNLAFMRSRQKPLDEVAEAMLRPMMQDWLDNNLPGIVERLVREEIARIARGDI
jgi:uncharacterized protein